MTLRCRLASAVTREFSKQGELVSALATVEQFTQLSTGFALVSDSALLMNVNPTRDQTQPVGRFADGKLIQALDVKGAYLIRAAGKQWARILTQVPGYSDGPGIAQTEFEASHHPN